MNYLKELNAFYDQQETNPLSSSAIAVWHALMHICNKAGWPADFTVAASVICLKAGLKERSFYNARNELKQKSYVTFTSRKGNQAAVYQLHTLAIPYARSIADKPIETLADKTVPVSAGNVSSLIKHKSTKHKKDNPYTFYEANGFGTLSPFITDDMTEWIANSKFEEPEKIMIEAMKIALMQNVRNWRYASKILQDWHHKQLYTDAAIQADQLQRRSRASPFAQKQKEGDTHETSQRSAPAGHSEYDFGF
ncbi:hypothetical protein AAV35_14205 [Salimicrobium jeotgali]|uniref:Primosome subunit n=1 Tax=Salimicrobium jeotgali TaxID=1230341 RepID=K2GLN4_9BACI|nr:DnaD domain protein [Salimicrobium jeotgali]APC65603.1 hypothetical protein AAV35_14205 [Salimicrobium jeotgali]EKE31314.1 primosome subunit [Salimicrobium jeotgali]MBM7696921.1 DnaD/phage-associated family protein [Salimicrobium jeotgali]